MEHAMPKRIRSALYLDFDNIFGGLLELDREAALAFANDVTNWLERFRQFQLPSDMRRDLLVQRAYLNPNGWIEDAELGNDSGRLYLQRFRPILMRAGFEVIDCPAVTRQQKNAADIRIVIDVMLALEGNVRYDEVLIASSDSDFTPLLHVLRARDFRIGLLSAGEVSAAYRSVAHLFVGAEQLISLVRGLDEPVDDDDELDAGPRPKPVAAQDAPVETAETVSESSAGDAVAHVLKYLASSDKPVYLADLGSSLHENFGKQIQATNWFGHSALNGFLRSVPGAGLQVNGAYVWDPTRHDSPRDQASAAHKSSAPKLPAIIEGVCQATEMPRLPAENWPRLFGKLAEYARGHRFNLTECTAWVRDKLREDMVQVGRQSVGNVVKGALMGGVSLKADPPPDADRIREGYAESIISRAESQGVPLDDRSAAAMRVWLAGQWADAAD
jgi:uncharacterized LabA/DUF88 family protein